MTPPKLPHLHAPGTPEMVIFVAQLLLAGFIIRALTIALVQLNKPWSDRLAGALGFLFP